MKWSLFALPGIIIMPLTWQIATLKPGWGQWLSYGWFGLCCTILIVDQAHKFIERRRKR